jgi:hypothetical protein
MVSRPALRILPFLVALTAALGVPSIASAANHAPVCIPFTQSVAPFPASRVVSIRIPAISFCTDADGDQLSYTVVGAGAKGTVDGTDLAHGDFTYSPTFGSSGDDTLTLVAHDPSGASSTPVAITMRITNVNQPPICLDDPVVYPVAENVPTQLVGHCYDPDAIDNDGAHVPTFNLLPPAHGVAVPTNAGFNYLPNQDYLGPDVIHYTMTDAEGASSAGSGSTQVIVTAADAPTCQVPATIVQRVGRPITGLMKCTDNVNTPPSGFTYQIASAPSDGDVTVNQSDGSFTYTPTLSTFAGVDSFSFTATNFAGSSHPVQQTVQYSATFNSPPQCTGPSADPVYVHENRPVTLSFSCSDAQSDPITLVDSTQGTIGTLAAPAPAGGGFTVTYTPNNNVTGLDTVAVQPHDDQTTSSTGSAVTLDLDVISDANEQAPSCAAGTLSVHNNDTSGAIFVPDCSDFEGDPITLSVTTPASHGTVTGPDSNGVFSYVPSSSYTGSDSFTLTASDGIKTSSLPVAVTVLPPNHPPTCANFTLSADHSAATSFDLGSHCTDPDQGDTVTVVLDTSTVHGVLSAVSPTGHVTFTPNTGYAGGTDSFTYHAFDSSGATSGEQTGTVDIDQVPTCNAPSGTLTVAHNNALHLSPCTDPDGDILTYTSDQDPADGTLSTANGELLYTPNPGFAGADSFQVHADDGRGGVAAPMAIAVNVGADNPPSCTPRTFTLGAGTSQVVPLTCTDPDGDTVTPSVVRPPTHGTVSVVANGNVTYTPFAGFGGADTFSFRGTDSDPSKLTSPLVTVTLTVTGGTTPPPLGTAPGVTKTPPATTTTPGAGDPGTTSPGTGEHAKTLAEIAQGILGAPVAQVDVGFGSSVPAFVVKGVGSTLKVKGTSSTFLVYFCNCAMTVNQVLSGTGTSHSKSAKKGTTVKSTLAIPKPGSVKVKLTSAQAKAVAKGATITLKVTFTTPGPKPKNKKQKQKTLKTTRTWKVKALKVTKTKK